MHNKFPPVPVRIAVILVVLGTLGYYGYRSLTTQSNGTLNASGSIEGTIVNVSPELAGKVAEVYAREGDSVKAGDPLLRLDGSLLTAQRAVASAALDSANTALTGAQNQFNQALANAVTAQQASTTKDWRFSAPDQFNQPAWYFTGAEQLKAAQAETDAAQSALKDSLANLDKVIQDISNADFLAAETRLANARAAFIVADQVKTSADYAAEGGGLQSAADAAYNSALNELNAAQSAYNAMLNTTSAKTVLNARGQVAVAQARYDTASARLLALQTGGDSPIVVLAADKLSQAESAVAQAESNLALLDVQIAKLTVYAPADGVILTRNVEPGEFVQPGAVALSMADLTTLNITVYVPEDRYGQISLGQTVTVSVDSFPGVTFTGTVTHIADQAEFTPRNVQTAEGRSSTVIAIKIDVADSAGKLKIGMPADVLFQ